MNDVPGKSKSFFVFITFFGRNRCFLDFQNQIPKNVKFECQDLQSTRVHQTGLVLERVSLVLDVF